METCRFALALILAALSFPGISQEDSVARSLAATCANCHGTEGRSVTKDVAPLAGLPREHIVTQMKAFKDGTRQATIMHQVAKGFTDQQIDAMAGYFAAQRK